MGVVPAVALLAAEGGRRVAALGAERAAVAPDADQEQVALLALQHGVTAVPVVSTDGRLLGVVPPLALIDILHREHVEDLHRLAGIAREQDFAREALESPPLRRVRNRLPWLLAGVVGSVAATLLMARFEHLLTERVALAFFVPAIVYLADAVGTQTETLAVRALALSRLSLRRLAAAELGTGLLIGCLLAGIALPLVWAALSDARLAIAVSAAVLAACSAATTIGILLPWLLQRLGFDPAFGSGPLATVVQDVLSLASYFAVVLAVAP
jgi:magnesium transporter